MGTNDAPKPRRWAQVKEIAEYFEVTRATVYTWIKVGKVRATLRGDTVRVPIEEFEYIKVHGLRTPRAPSSPSDDEPAGHMQTTGLIAA
jgi:excisionase family DNA binding protein